MSTPHSVLHTLFHAAFEYVCVRAETASRNVQGERGVRSRGAGVSEIEPLGDPSPPVSLTSHATGRGGQMPDPAPGYRTGREGHERDLGMGRRVDGSGVESPRNWGLSGSSVPSSVLEQLSQALRFS